jgi:cytochrome c
MAVRLLRTALAKPTLSEQEAIDLVDYYRERNRVAHDSHRKSWLAKHKSLAKKLLL